MDRALVVGSTVPALSRDGVILLMAAEARAIHRLCDEAKVDTHAFGERLSISQRVELLTLKVK